jgi:hypothetical protein
MLKGLLVVLVIVVVAVGGVLAYATTKPNTFKVQRAALITAPADKIFPLIADFHEWTRWSPYEKRDPDMKRHYGGAVGGKGATYSWEGNGQVGAGRMEITEAQTPSKVALALDMIKPISAHNTVVFTLEPQGEATRVTWAMSGNVPYFAKIIHVFMNMDKMVGGDFEAGLANLQAAAASESGKLSLKKDQP